MNEPFDHDKTFVFTSQRSDRTVSDNFMKGHRKIDLILMTIERVSFSEFSKQLRKELNNFTPMRNKKQDENV